MEPASHVSSDDAAPATLRLMGAFELWVGPRLTRLPTQAQRVVALLALCARSERRATLAGQLWPYTSQNRAQANLRTALWRIGQEASIALECEREAVRLAPNVSVDVARVAGLAHNLGSDVSEAATELLRHDLLPGWDEEWLTIERERLRQLRVHALEALSRQLLAQGRHAEAIDVAYAAVAVEPLRESSQLALINAFVAEGNRSEAMRHYRRYAGWLMSELGMKPSDGFDATVCDIIGAGTTGIEPGLALHRP